MKLQFSINRLLASALMVGIGAACIGILCRLGFQLRQSNETPFYIAATAGASIGIGLAFLLRWPIVAQVACAITGAIAGAIILLVIVIEKFNAPMP